LIFAPIWGRLSDRTGRRPLVLIGIGGYVVAQLLFGLSTSLVLLYAARILGGILSSATLPVAAAYVSDSTTDEERGHGMAWFGTAVSLGFVVGPAIGGVLAQRDMHFAVRFAHLKIDSFSVPFFAAAALGLLTLFAAMRWLPESLPAHPANRAVTRTRTDWRRLARSYGPLLGLSFVAQFGLAVFEGTFALYAQTRLSYGPNEVGAVFVVCGLVMAVFQVGALAVLSARMRELWQTSLGFGVTAAGLILLAFAVSKSQVYTFVGMLALGLALLSPNLAAMLSKLGGRGSSGQALGFQNAANSFGQAAGPLVGSALLLWNRRAPFVVSGALFVAAAVIVGWMARSDHAVRRLDGIARGTTP
jgi:DHA1 family multidrug resistance protein-like MFS transporter